MQQKIFITEDVFLRLNPGNEPVHGTVAMTVEGKIVWSHVDTSVVIRELLKLGYDPENIYIRGWVSLKGHEDVRESD